MNTDRRRPDRRGLPSAGAGVPRGDAPTQGCPDALDPSRRHAGQGRSSAILAEAGFAGITWPRRIRRARASPAASNGSSTARPPPSSFLPAALEIGLGMCGPTILAHGTEEQKRTLIPPLLRGDHVWCELFSEPGAGSDLASVQTRARRDGDTWVLDGQKVWTSGAQHSRPRGLPGPDRPRPTQARGASRCSWWTCARPASRFDRCAK